MASRTTTKPLRVLKSDDASFAEEFATLCDRSGPSKNQAKLEASVRETIATIRQQGDTGLIAAVKRATGAKLEALEVTPAEWDEACESVDPVDRAAIGKAAMRIRAFHRKRIPSSWEMREEGGASMGQRVRPLDSVGIYLPTEECVRPTSVIMYTTPASVVEVPEIILTTAPGKNGKVNPEILMAARVAGVHRVFKSTGAAAVTAMALGTDSVPRVDKIIGPGEAEGSTAKHLLMGDVGVDTKIGSSEVCIIADTSATPAWIAADLISQAEKSSNSQQIFITHSKPTATRVLDQVTRQLKTLDRAEIAKKAMTERGAIIVTKSQNESIALANQYAAERLVLAVKDPDAAHKLVKNAGAVFLGHYTPVSVGDYLAGPNHALPTGGSARFLSPLSVEDFLKRTTFMRFEPPKLRELGAEVIRLAEVEGLAGPGRSVDLRLQKIRRVRREREAAREAEM
ncbi:MAG: histidinol dehydrogenase [Myxococcota bacterium]|nr:histidinol dehydrogenase [Myxococcota bacterium]